MTGRRSPTPARYLLLFVAVQGLLFPLTVIEPTRSLFIVPFTAAIARLSAWVMELLDPTVQASGAIIRNARTGFGVQIEAGCNGVEPTIILAAAILAFPSALLEKALGILVGLVLIQLLNLIRIVSLYYLGQWNQVAFEWAHSYVWQALIMVDAIVIWLFWLRWVRRRATKE